VYIRKNSPLEATYSAQGRYDIQGKIWLVDRRAYFYYFAKLFRRIDDMISFSIITPFTPGCSLIVVPKSQTRLLEQALSYSDQLEIISIRGLEDYLVLTDNATGVKSIFDAFTVQELGNLREYLLYLVVDYAAPNVELYVNVSEKNYAELIPRILMLVRNIAEKTRRVSPRRVTMDTMKMLKRSLSKIMVR